MRVIPVIDLMNGQVVRGIAGRRSTYRPMESSIAADARPATVARAFVEQFGFDAVYVADLDAIMDARPNMEAWKKISEAGLKLWIDAGTGTPESVLALDKQLTDFTSNATIIIGLESLPKPSMISDLIGKFIERSTSRFQELQLAFSLDLADGKPLTSIDSWKELPPTEIAHRFVKFGAKRLVVLDLADVGVGGGTRTLELCRQIRTQFPTIELIAGGGVRGPEDLRALADAGCDAALVASALHDGRLTADDVSQAGSLSY